LTERRERIAALAFPYDDLPKEEVASCNLCGCTRFAVVSHEDRYGFNARSLGCIQCGLVFLSPRLTAEGYATFYADSYRPLVSAFHGRLIDAQTVENDQQPYTERLATLLAPFADTTGGTILDAGGSTGVVSERLAKRLAMQAVVLDPSPDEVARAQARGLEGIVGTIEGWAPAERRFELVLLCQTIDHLSDVSASLARLREVITNDGIFFVDIVDFRAAFLRNWNIEAATKIDHPYSLTEATAEAFLARAGFEIALKDYAADHLHVGYVCRPATNAPNALPAGDTVTAFYRELRYVQNAPRA
jgi:SAM-dependent methyltransferase